MRAIEENTQGTDSIIRFIRGLEEPATYLDDFHIDLPPDGNLKERLEKYEEYVENATKTYEKLVKYGIPEFLEEHNFFNFFNMYSYGSLFNTQYIRTSEDSQKPDITLNFYNIGQSEDGLKIKITYHASHTDRETREGKKEIILTYYENAKELIKKYANIANQQGV